MQCPTGIEDRVKKQGGITRGVSYEASLDNGGHCTMVSSVVVDRTNGESPPQSWVVKVTDTVLYTFVHSG
jgi:hypothetical protein